MFGPSGKKWNRLQVQVQELKMDLRTCLGKPPNELIYEG